MGYLKELPVSDRSGWPWSEETDESLFSGSDWPKISIVTPSFNQAAFIEETIRSIVLQNYPNLEYIVMDGGSSDSTIKILEKYSPWISEWVSEKDKGQSDAIIKGFDRSHGILLNWINSDDILCRDALYNIAKAYKENHNPDFIHGKNGIMNIHSELYSWMPHPKDCLEMRYLYEMPYGQQACFFTSAIYSECGAVNPELHFSIDFELYLKMHLAGARSVQIDSHIGNIRIHGNTKTAQLETVMHQENGNAMMTFFDSVGDKRKVQFLKRMNHRLYTAYKVNITIGSKRLNRIWLAYLKKNIWYYYNIGNVKIAKDMAIEIIKNDIKSLFNFDYLKIIKDGTT